MAAASAEKKITVSKVFRAGRGLSRTPLSAARGEAFPLKFSDGGMLREKAAPAPRIPRFYYSRPPCGGSPAFFLASFSCFSLNHARENFPPCQDTPYAWMQPSRRHDAICDSIDSMGPLGCNRHLLDCTGRPRAAALWIGYEGTDRTLSEQPHAAAEQHVSVSSRPFSDRRI
jgi:hypothetical protein